MVLAPVTITDAFARADTQEKIYWTHRIYNMPRNTSLNRKKGSNCEIVDCPRNCTNGQCKKPNECSCFPGWSDAECETPICSNCSKTGKCIGPNLCACQKGYSGVDCSTQIETRSDYCLMNSHFLRNFNSNFIRSVNGLHNKVRKNALEHETER